MSSGRKLQGLKAQSGLLNNRKDVAFLGGNGSLRGFGAQGRRASHCTFTVTFYFCGFLTHFGVKKLEINYRSERVGTEGCLRELHEELMGRSARTEAGSSLGGHAPDASRTWQRLIQDGSRAGSRGVRAWICSESRADNCLEQSHLPNATKSCLKMQAVHHTHAVSAKTCPLVHSRSVYA